MSLGKRLKTAREALKLGQKEFAENIEIIYQTVSKYEREEIKPTVEILQKLKNTYKININWLIDGDGEMFLGEHKDAVFRDQIYQDMMEAYDKLSPEKQRRYYFKMIADSIE